MHKRKLTGFLAVLTAVSLSAGSFGAVPVYAQTVTASAKGASYSDTTSGGNAVLVDGKTVTLSGVTVTKSGDSSSEDADFYGTNAAVLAKNGASLTITESKITSAGSHANAVFSYGSGTTVNISDSTIRTTGNNSGGIMTTGGATMNASDLDIETDGNSSAAIRSDRGGGDVNVDGGTYVTNGVGSPVIYSTADIDVENASLTSTKSEAIVIEGGNSVSLTDCSVVGNNTKTNGQATNYDNIFIYQSMSGDASEGTSSFEMSGGSLTAKNGDMFYVTNTTCTILLEDVDITYADGDLIALAQDAWGSSGSNGGNATFNAVSQDLAGTISVDSVSSLNLILDGSSSYSGSINSSGQTYVELADGAVWTLTGNSTITSLTCGANAVNLNGYTLTVGGSTYKSGTASTGSKVSQTSSGSSQGTSGQPGQDGTTPPAKPDGSDSGQPGQDGTTPPAKPDGSDSGQPGQDGTTPPAKPDGSDSGQPGQHGTTPPAKPDGSDSGQPGQDGTTPPAKPDGSDANSQSGQTSAAASATISFKDVQDPSNTYYKAIYWAASKGITKGYSDGTFGINRTCTRGEAMMFLWRYMGKPTPKTVSKSPFTDVSTTHTYYKAILWAYQTGIAKGYSDGTFGVDKTCSRGDIMMFIWRAMGKQTPSVTAKQTFSDVSMLHAYYKAILWGYQKGITTGYTSGSKKGTFGLTEGCTRGQIVTFLYRIK